MKTLDQLKAELIKLPQPNGRTPKQYKLKAYEIIKVIAEEIKPCTLRQLYYQLVNHKVLDKTENEYNKLGRWITDMRERGLLPWDYIEDRGREIKDQMPDFDYKGDNVVESMEFQARYHSLTPCKWEDTDRLVIISLEKNALAGIFERALSGLPVILIVTIGFSSITYIKDLADLIKKYDKGRTYVFQFGDFDPSGENIAASFEKKLREYLGDWIGKEFDWSIPRPRGWSRHRMFLFHRKAVTPQQIELYNLPTRPMKDSDRNRINAEKYVDGCVEVDAIPPKELVNLIQECTQNCAKEKKLDRQYLRDLSKFQGTIAQDWLDGLSEIIELATVLFNIEASSKKMMLDQFNLLLNSLNLVEWQLD